MQTKKGLLIPLFYVKSQIGSFCLKNSGWIDEQNER